MRSDLGSLLLIVGWAGLNLRSFGLIFFNKNQNFHVFMFSLSDNCCRGLVSQGVGGNG